MRMKRGSLLVLVVVLFFVLLLIVGVNAEWDGESGSYNADEEGGVFGLNDNIIAVATNAETDYKFNKYTVTLNTGGTIQIKGNSFPIDSSEENENVFVFGPDDELMDGSEFVSGGGEFILKGYKIELPEGTKVEYKNGEVVFNFPIDKEIVKPEKSLDDVEDFDFSYESSSKDEGITLPGGLVVGGRGESVAKVYADGKGFYLGKEGVVVKTGDGKDGLLVNVPSEDRKVYFASSSDEFGDDVDYIYVGEGEVILNSPKYSGKGVSVFVLPDNDLGIVATHQNTVSAQVANGKAIIRKSSESGKLADVRISGESIADLDGRSFFALDGKLYFYSKRGLIADFDQGYYDADVKITLTDRNDKNLDEYSIYSNGRDQYASVNEEDDLKSGLEYVETSEGFFVANSVSFNRLTPDAQKFYSSLSKEDQDSFVEAIKLGKKGDIKDEEKEFAVLVKDKSALMQGMLDNAVAEAIAEQKRKRRDPFKATAKVNARGSGGTATHIGDGYFLTAGHVIDSVGKGGKVTLTLAGGEKVTGLVVNSMGYGRSASSDVSLIKVNSHDMSMFPYIPVASVDHVMEKGDMIIRMDRPGTSKDGYDNTQITRVAKSGTIVTYDAQGPIPGDSGGMLAHIDKEGNVWLIGVTSMRDRRGGGYSASPIYINTLLEKNGVGHLSLIVRVFGLNDLFGMEISLLMLERLF